MVLGIAILREFTWKIHLVGRNRSIRVSKLTDSDISLGVTSHPRQSGFGFVGYEFMDTMVLEDKKVDRFWG
jgi:hypothetical protein